jgi:sulfatase maturation enzyme AslB (radical SAM superfamily)
MLGGLDGSGRLALKESNLSALLEYKEALGCLECGVHAYCGGRCPVQAVIGSPERTLQYCQLMRLHTGTVKEFIPAISFAMKKNNIDPQYLFNRSACIAGYTDVVPDRKSVV